jgi:hypothetical protein
MPDIKLTGARLDVLKGVAAGEVSHHRNWGRDPDEDIWRPGGYGRKKVNGAVEFLRTVHLIQLGPASGPSMYSAQPWVLTANGEQWLARAEQESNR